MNRIEEKIENPISTLPSKSVSQTIEKPLIILLETRPKLDFQTKQAKTLDKINQMLKEIKREKPSTSALTNNEKEDVFVQTTDTSYDRDSSTIKNIDLLEKNFQDFDLKPEIARLSSKPKSISFTNNWYSKPTPPDLQSEENIFQSQSSYSANKTHEWNIDGMSE